MSDTCGISSGADNAGPAVFAEVFAVGQQMALEEAFVTLFAPPAVAPQSQEIG